MTNLEQSISWIPDAWSVKLTFSLIVTFYFTKTENGTKIALSKGTIFNKKCWLFARELMTSANLRGFWY